MAINTVATYCLWLLLFFLKLLLKVQWLLIMLLSLNYCCHAVTFVAVDAASIKAVAVVAHGSPVVKPSTA